jgi:LmbE family N-acetylglucosaminyl deacetylase
MRWIYLSPHLDDAALSAGGLIREQARADIPVEIWTLMSGFPPAGDLSPFAQVTQRLWGFPSAEEAIQGRRQEDRNAASILGAGAAHFDFLDCIYRQGPDGQWLYPQDVCVDPHPLDLDLPGRIAEAVSIRLLPDDVLVCQFGIGRHVDHQLVRAAAGLLGRPLWYVADIPYLFNSPGELVPNTAGMNATLHPVSESSFHAWQEAVLAYSSQLSTLFDGQDTLRARLRSYWEDKRGIDLWRLDNLTRA